MSTSVIGQRARDDAFKKYFAVLKSCQQAGIEPPKEVSDYFGEHCNGYDNPEYIAEQALEVDLSEIVQEREGDGSLDYVVEIAKLPESVVSIIFRNSW